MAKLISVSPADVQHGLTIFSNAKIDLGVISPCSNCKNRRSKQLTKKLANGKEVILPACPRVAVKEAQKNSRLSDDQDSVQHLMLAGKDGAFSNPILDDQNKTYWIWVARLLDNSGSYDMEGQFDRSNPDGSSELCPPITARNWDKKGGYDTDFMQCMALPMVPDVSFMKLVSDNNFKEGSYCLITHFQGQQLRQGRIPISVGGFCHPLDIAGAMKFTAPKKPQGVKA